ncbi:MAG: esterase/lipase family protein [Tepidiformaceae bacterium]
MLRQRTLAAAGGVVVIAFIFVWAAWPMIHGASEAPLIVFEPNATAHQGYETELAGRVVTEQPVVAEIRFGDGVTAPLLLSEDGTFRVSHRYTGAGRFEVELRVFHGDAVEVAAHPIAVAPRKVLFVQGLNSQSRCPDGDAFVDRGPRWMRDLLESDGFAGELELGADSFAYFSYSGEYCEGGIPGTVAAPDYRKSATCAGIADVTAPRLRALVESFAPSRVTIVAHSMGGVVAAYAIGDDPAWARERIASVVTFDSPLGGLDGARSEILALVSDGGGGCERDDPALVDLRTGSEVSRVVASAGGVVPLFTLDGSAHERAAFGLAEAVPGSDTSLEGNILHWEVDEAHSSVWDRVPVPGENGDRGQFVACGVLVRPEMCTDTG